MRQNFFFLFSFLVLVLFSCKKDYDFDEEALIDKPYVQHFYATGNMYDETNNVEFDFIIDSVQYEPFTLYVGSASDVQVDNGKKYIISAVAFNPESIKSHLNEPYNNNYMDLLNNFLAVKIKSDRPASEVNRRFTRAELLEFLEVGKSYKYGDNPFEVEVGIQIPPPDTLTPQFSFLGYIGNTVDVDNENSTFEILEIEDYEDEEVQNPLKGLKVRVRLNANVRYYQWPILKLTEVEAVLLFEYD